MERRNVDKATMEVPEGAAYLGLGKTTMYQLIHEPDFPVFRVGKKILIDRAGLEQWKSEKMKEGI